MMNEATLPTIGPSALPTIDLSKASRDEMVGFIMALRALVLDSVVIPIEMLQLAVEVSRRLSMDKTGSRGKAPGPAAKPAGSARSARKAFSLGDLT